MCPIKSFRNFYIFALPCTLSIGVLVSISGLSVAPLKETELL